ncbi:hypothetical protein [Oceanibium sediminis]|uniref:hypothetical protein n=1 Tax=Oceanibium sediminis TaxID=2026339 RepID=UPI000DD4AB47|nr:hypothetical protein [Oceanibium sediminis]
MIGQIRQRQLARRLLSLLEEERAALVAGNLAALGPLATRITDAMTALGAASAFDDPAPDRTLQKIHAAAAHNQTLAEASRRGLTTAMRLRDETLGMQSRMQTYTGGGQTRTIMARKSTSDRRA